MVLIEMDIGNFLESPAVGYWLMKSEPEECSVDDALTAPNATVPWVSCGQVILPHAYQIFKLVDENRAAGRR